MNTIPNEIFIKNRNSNATRHINIANNNNIDIIFGKGRIMTKVKNIKYLEKRTYKKLKICEDQRININWLEVETQKTDENKRKKKDKIPTSFK